MLFGAVGDLHGDFDALDSVMARHPEIEFWVCPGDLAAEDGAYPTPRGSMRPSHIHFEVFGKRERLITQLYFAGDPHQDTDTWLRSSPSPDTIVMPVREPAPGMEPEEKLVVFDIVLMHG